MDQKKVKSLWRRRTASLMVVVFMAGSLLFDMPPAYAAEESEGAEGQAAATETEEERAVDAETEGEQPVTEETAGEQSGIPEDKSYTGEGYKVDASVTTYWEGGYNLYVTISNTSEETIHNWGVLFETRDSIADLYNADIMNDTEGVYLLRNKVYNQDIPAGGSVSFGYTAHCTGAADVPEEYTVSSIEKTVEGGGFTVSCLVSDAWDGGAVVQLMIENTSDKAIEDWILEFDSNMQMEELWNADLVSFEAGHYILRNVSYAQNIPAGETAVAGMRLSALPGTEGELLENVTVRQIVPSGESGSTPSDNQVSDNNVSDNNVSDNDVSGNEIPEGVINRLSTGGDGGEIYYKTSYESDVVTAPDGLPCIRNQFLLSADDTISFTEVEAYLAQNGARIVGYIEATNDYQVEMYRETDITEVQELTERIGLQAWVRHIGLNYLWLEEAEFKTTDPWSESGNTAHGDLSTSFPGGHNWGLDAIDYVGALVNAGVISSQFDSASNISTNHLTTVRMGIYDTAFDEWHEDLDDNFVCTWNNFRQYKCDENCLDHGMHVGLWNAFVEQQLIDEENRELVHGTHVAGIMCAEFNNGTGINGICIKNELYGYASHGPEWVMPEDTTDGRVHNTFEAMCGFGVLITSDVKVINYSMGEKDGLAYAASVDTGEGRENALEYLDIQSGYMEEFLSQFLDNGYDFLIVTSAGNDNDDVYYQCSVSNNKYIGGYITVRDAEKEIAKGYQNVEELAIEVGVSFNASGNVDAKYNSILNCISDNSPCYAHILCVGSVNYDRNGNYPISVFSNGGDRVEIYAPGSYIYSTYLTGCAHRNDDRYYEVENINYGRLSGTSMAAPHVSGVAGLAYNVDPNISAADLKQIIINTARNNNGFPLLNAADVIADVVQNKELNETEEYTIQLHVTDENGNNVRGAAVEVHNRSVIWHKYFDTTLSYSAADGIVVDSGETDAVGNIKLDIPQGNYYVLVNGKYGGIVEEIAFSSEDIVEKPVREITISGYLTDKIGRVHIQLSRVTASENVNAYGFVMQGEIRFIKGWIDTSDMENIHTEDYVREEVDAGGEESIAVYYTDNFGRIIALLPEGIYTVEVTLPDEEPQYYHIIVSDRNNCRGYRFEV